MVIGNQLVSKTRIPRSNRGFPIKFGLVVPRVEQLACNQKAEGSKQVRNSLRVHMGKKKCKICKTRPVNSRRSNHHLKPKWGNGDTSRKEKIDSCIDCHKNIHRLFSNEELYEEYNTVEKLRAELQRRLTLEALANIAIIEKNLKEEGTVAPMGRAPVSYAEQLHNAECKHLQSKREVEGSSGYLHTEIEPENPSSALCL